MKEQKEFDKQRALAYKKADLYDQMMLTFKSFFRPEFLNRIDDIVIFNPITRDILRKIVDNQLNMLIAMVKKEKEIDLQVTENAKNELGEV